MGYRCRPQPHAPLEDTPNLKQQALCWGCPTHTEHLAARLAQPQAARTAQSTARPCSELKVSRNKKFFACRVSPAVPNPGGISQVAEPQPWASPPSGTTGDAQPQRLPKGAPWCCHRPNLKSIQNQVLRSSGSQSRAHEAPSLATCPFLPPRTHSPAASPWSSSHPSPGAAPKQPIPAPVLPHLLPIRLTSPSCTSLPPQLLPIPSL